MPISPLERVGKVIRIRSSFLLVTHVDPDGDGIGSCLALWHALRNGGKTACVWLPRGIPEKYAFLPGSSEIVTTTAPLEVAIALDCDGENRLGPTRTAVRQAEVVVDIDHHTGHRAFGDLTWADPSAPATGYQIFQLLEAFGAPCTPEIASCLYCAIGTDSGFFRYSNTTANLLRVAAHLIECGANPKAIAEATLDRYQPPLVRLAGKALASVRTELGGRAAVAVLTADDFRSVGTDQTEGVIDYLRTVAGVDLLVLMRESEEGWRVSLRSLDDTDVGQVAKALGGGGHPSAAGCTLSGSLEEAWATLKSVLTGALETKTHP